MIPRLTPALRLCDGVGVGESVGTFSSTNSIDGNNKNTQAITKWQEDLLRNTVNSLKAMSFHVSSLYVTALHPYVNCVFF